MKLQDQVTTIAAKNGLKVSNAVSGALFPTPTAMDVDFAFDPVDKDGNPVSDPNSTWYHPETGRQVQKGITSMTRLLPTPLAQDTAGAMTIKDRAANGYGPALRDIEHLLPNHKSIDWGVFGAAIERWETIIDRPAPAPTAPDERNDTHRLSPKFVEWMMGLPAGWVSDVPEITRNEQLKALGNGVVPQQAELALRILLEANDDRP